MRMSLKKTARHVTESNWNGSHEKIVGKDGHLNAGSKRELMQRQFDLAKMINARDLFTDVSEVITPDMGESVNLEEAYHDMEQWMELGSGIAAEITERQQREGFMRNFLDRADVAEGATVRIRVKTPNVSAIVSRNLGMVYPQFVRDRFLAVDEYTIHANPRVEELEIHQGSGDILEDKFYEAQEQIMVAEDRQLLAQFRKAQGIYNAPIYFVGNFTPTIMRGMTQNITDWNLPQAKMVFANDIMSDLLVGNDFTSWYDPISQYEIVQTGRLGSLLGLELITDGFREPTLQVLEQGEVHCTTTAPFLGAYTDRGPVRSEPVTAYADGQPARGWYLSEHISCTVANAKGVASAIRQ